MDELIDIAARAAYEVFEHPNSVSFDSLLPETKMLLMSISLAVIEAIKDKF